MADKKKLDTELSGETNGITSEYTAPKNAAMDSYLNREKFSYDVNGDALYQQYKDKYTLGGRMAMQDTMGQAQAMTGGYGNSYAQSVGQQAYQGYMQQLNDVIPELYSLAYGMYNDEGQRLLDQYSIYADLEDKDISRQTTERAYQYGLERDRIADEQWQATFDYQKEQDAYDRAQDAKANALSEAQLAASMGDYSLLEALGYDTSKIPVEEIEYDTLTDEQIASLREAASLGDATKDKYTEDDPYFERVLNDLTRYANYYNVDPDLLKELTAELIPEAYLDYLDSKKLYISDVVGTGVDALRDVASFFGGGDDKRIERVFKD